MNIYDLIKSRRTIRKFKQDKIDRAILEKLIEAARLAPSGANMQPLKYKIVDDTETVNSIFQNVKWAAYIAPDGTPSDDEKPTAFIAVLADTEIKKSGYELDIGAAIQNILLCAEAEKIGSCWMGAINRDNIRNILNIPERYVINSVIALGYKGEQPVSEDEEGSIKYYKDDSGVLHVPKRSFKDILI